MRPYFTESEPALLLGLFGRRRRNILSKEALRAVVVFDVPKILRHRNDEAPNDQHSQQRRVLACEKHRSDWMSKSINRRRQYRSLNFPPTAQSKQPCTCLPEAYVRTDERIDQSQIRHSIHSHVRFRLTLLRLRFFRWLESRSCIIVHLVREVNLVFAVDTFPDHFLGHELTRRAKRRRQVGISRWNGIREDRGCDRESRKSAGQGFLGL
jgi:hypothetical protein